MLISHDDRPTYNVEEHILSLHKNKKLTSPIENVIQIAKELNSIELGRFLLANKGLNGFWTAYLILHGIKQKNLTPIEHWLLFDAPGVVATRERFYIFQEILQSSLIDNMHLASIPCGLMDDLLKLDFSNLTNIQITGIDLDKYSLSLAKDNAAKHDITFANFIHKNAWDLNISNTFDVITSNGLNIYERDDKRVIELYKQLCNSLKLGGKLITSFVTPPPTISPDSTWKDVPQADAIKQQIIFGDIIQANWQEYRTESQTSYQLENAGFIVDEIIYDKFGMFPTIVATKRDR